MTATPVKYLEMAPTATGRIGAYQLNHELASDGCSTSYLATHLVLPRRAVVKVMHETADHAASFLAVQVLREACILDALQHPGIVRVYESGVQRNRAWFAVEHVDGPTLADVLAIGRLDRHQAIALLRDLTEVLEHAHRRGVVHGGLRPEHVVVAPRVGDFPLCIIDWSTARAHDAAPVPYTPTLDSWHYTAPEVVAGLPIDDRADLFSLGVIAHQIVTGEPFTRGGTRTDRLSADAPRELNALIDRMLAAQPADRPSSTDLRADLAWLADTLSNPALQPDHVRIRRPRWTPPIDVQRHARLFDRAKTDRDLEPVFDPDDDEPS